MSDESVGLVRQIYEAWNEQGPAAIRPMMAADVELHDAPEILDAQEWRGRDAVVARLEAVTAAIGGGSMRFEGFSRQGDAVLVKPCAPDQPRNSSTTFPVAPRSSISFRASAACSGRNRAPTIGRTNPSSTSRLTAVPISRFRSGFGIT
jgi:hypothetical protein